MPKLRRKGGNIHRRVLIDFRGEDSPGSRMARVMRKEVVSAVAEMRGVCHMTILDNERV